MKDDPMVSWMHDATKTEHGEPVPLPVTGKALTAILLSASSVLMFFGRNSVLIEVEPLPQTERDKERDMTRLLFKLNVGEWQGPEQNGPEQPEHEYSKNMMKHIGGKTLDDVTAFREALILRFDMFLLCISGRGVALSRLDALFIPDPSKAAPKPC